MIGLSTIHPGEHCRPDEDRTNPPWVRANSGHGRAQPEFLFNARDGAGELFATAFGGAPQRGGDRRPIASLRAQLGDPAFVLGQPETKEIEQLPRGDKLAGRFIGWTREMRARFRPGAPANVPTSTLMIPNLLGELVTRHPDQECDELSRLVQVKLADRRPDEEARQHGLTDVRRIEHPLEAWVAQPQPASDFEADSRS